MTFPTPGWHWDVRIQWGVELAIIGAAIGLAVASLVLGLLGMWLLALIFGYVGKNQIDRSGGAQGGSGMAVAGLVLGWIGLGILVVVLIALASAAGSTSGYLGPNVP